MTVNATPGYWAGRARQTVADLLKLSQTLESEYRTINNHSDENLSSAGLQRAREAMQDALKLQVTQTARKAAEVASTALIEAEKAAAPHRPTYNPSDVAQLTRSEQAWRIGIQPQLDAGKQWPEIVATLDHDGLIAVQRFAAQYESAKRDRFTQNEVPVVVENLRILTDARVVETAPEGPARDAMRELVDVRNLHAAVTKSATALANVRGERDVVGASVTVKNEAYAVGANPVAMQAAAAA